MGGGRKNLMRAAEEKILTIQPGQSIMQVLDLRGSNLIEVLDAKGEKSLALFPAKFQKSMWIKRGNFVVVDESGREEAAEFGRKVGCVVLQVLFHEQVRVLKKSPEWPDVFKASNSNQDLQSQNSHIKEKDNSSGQVFKVSDSNQDLQSENSQIEENENSSDDDGLPPLEANTNRLRPFQSHSEAETESSDSESDS